MAIEMTPEEQARRGVALILGACIALFGLMVAAAGWLRALTVLYVVVCALFVILWHLYGQ